MSDLNDAFAALTSYDRGSGRGALLPIDEAVRASLGDKSARKELESRLVTALKAGGSVVAREYICSKLAVIGSAFCVPALAELLPDLRLATAARTVLEAVPAPRAATALRDSLSRLHGVQKLGVIHSLGSRRDTGSVRALILLLAEPEPDIVAAAAAALGDIASTKAAKALRSFLAKAPQEVGPRVADAVLACAEGLLGGGRKAGAKALYQALLIPTQPAHVRSAAANGLARTEAQEASIRSR